MLPNPIEQAAQTLLTQHANHPVTIKNFTHASGGCINQAGIISTNQGKYFLKWNDRDLYPGMFEAEAKGLQLLADLSTLRIPGVIGTTVAGNQALLILECIHQGNRKPDFSFDFGQKLARQHQCTQAQFGLDHDNYIGSLPQSNARHADWTTFFIEERLQPQIKLALDNQEMSSKHVQQFEKLYPKLDDIFPKEPPALLHGDLWGGNYMVDDQGAACIYDPAVYYGHREAELAFTQLFGGYDSRFYEGYESIWPLEPGFYQRKDIYNLYPLMVHVNLFGGGYLSSVVSILDRFAA